MKRYFYLLILSIFFIPLSSFSLVKRDSSFFVTDEVGVISNETKFIQKQKTTEDILIYFPLFLL